MTGMGRGISGKQMNQRKNETCFEIKKLIDMQNYFLRLGCWSEGFLTRFIIAHTKIILMRDSICNPDFPSSNA